MRRIYKIILLLFLLAAVFYGFGNSVSAAGTNIVKVDFPCPTNLNLGSCPPATDIPGYLNNLYKFAVGIAGLLALGMIVAGGVYYTISAGSGDKQKEAKSMISSALLGILLLFGSYLILRTVNPQLTSLNVGFTDTSGNPLSKLTPTSTLGGQGVSFDNNCSDFSKMPTWTGSNQPLTTSCASRKAITAGDISVGSNAYYENKTITIPAGSTIWQFPYFIKKQGNPSAKCLIYAYRELGSNDTKNITLDENLELCAPQSQAAIASTSTYTNLPNTLTHADAVQSLRGLTNPVDVTSSGNCSDPNKSNCTSLDGIPRSVITNLIYISRHCLNASGGECSIVITGGTEVGHQTHGPGKPIVDLRFNRDLANYLKHSFAGSIDVICTTEANKEFRIGCNNYNETVDHIHVQFKL